jgi:hypothetical protein
MDVDRPIACAIIQDIEVAVGGGVHLTVTIILKL